MAQRVENRDIEAREQATDRLAEAAYVLSAADSRLRGRATRTPGALSLPHARALRVLAEHGPLSISELTTYTETSGAAVTQLVNGLVDAGYVTRERREDNRRVVTVTITATGRQRHEERQQVLVDAMAEQMNQLDAAQLEAAATIMRKLAIIYDRL
jgi:DNA-binding MarR family transcriptional regulator